MDREYIILISLVAVWGAQPAWSGCSHWQGVAGWTAHAPATGGRQQAHVARAAAPVLACCHSPCQHGLPHLGSGLHPSCPCSLAT